MTISYSDHRHDVDVHRQRYVESSHWPLRYQVVEGCVWPASLALRSEHICVSRAVALLQRTEVDLDVWVFDVKDAFSLEVAQSQEVELQFE